jgi:hypothetical protein
MYTQIISGNRTKQTTDTIPCSISGERICTYDCFRIKDYALLVKRLSEGTRIKNPRSVHLFEGHLHVKERMFEERFFQEM